MTDQPTNPLLTGKPVKGGRLTPEAMQELADSLNQTRWVIDRGRWYFVGELPDGNKALQHREGVSRKHREPPCTPSQAAAIMAEFGLKSNPLGMSPTN